MLVSGGSDGRNAKPVKIDAEKDQLHLQSPEFMQDMQEAVNALERPLPVVELALRPGLCRWLPTRVLLAVLEHGKSEAFGMAAYSELCSRSVAGRLDEDTTLHVLEQVQARQRFFERRDKIVAQTNWLASRSTNLAIALEALGLLSDFELSAVSLLSPAALEEVRNTVYQRILNVVYPLTPDTRIEELIRDTKTGSEHDLLVKLFLSLYSLGFNCSRCNGLKYTMHKGHMMASTTGGGGLMFGGQKPCYECHATGVHSRRLAMRTVIERRLQAAGSSRGVAR